MSLITESAKEVMLFYACRNIAELQRVLDPIGSMYASHCMHIPCIHVCYVGPGIWSPHSGGKFDSPVARGSDGAITKCNYILDWGKKCRSIC